MIRRIGVRRALLLLVAAGAAALVLLSLGAGRRRARQDQRQSQVTQLVTSFKLPLYLDRGTKQPNPDIWQAKLWPELPWYLVRGTRRPDPDTVRPQLWPEEDPGQDRITNQLMFVPRQLNGSANNKVILMYHGIHHYDVVKPGRDTFLEEGCPVSTCEVSVRQEDAQHADAIIFKEFLIQPPGLQRPNKQVWILHHMESPENRRRIASKDAFNWTASYRRDSDIVFPYGRWTPYADKSGGPSPRPRPDIPGHATNKTKKVAWFVSNCKDTNHRKEYAKELSKYIEVDIYGRCGTMKCPRIKKSNKCFDLLEKQYKFYLAFENSNCRDYITEKFLVTGLGHYIVPVVMGAPREDYARVAPPHSYIHVDDFASPKDLAEYLHRLDQDDALYSSYFDWKGSGEFINTHFYCRLCAMLHDTPDKQARQYEDINAWWRPPGVCNKGGPWATPHQINGNIE